FFKGAQWTPDGQCLVTSAEDWVLRTFVLSPDILTPKTEDETGLIPQINPWTSQQRPQLIRDFAVYPGFNLQDLNTTLVLSSTNDQPIRLGNVMDPNQSTYAHYPLIWATTEEYIGPTALTFTSDGNRFITGSKNLIAAFDVSRPNEQPIMQYRTDLSGASVRTKGVVSSFAISSQSTLAAGTFNRAVIIYGDEGFASEPMATFSLATKLAQPNPLGSGNGVSSMAWSPCGRYLYVSERKSECVHLYDIRGLGRRLASLVRPAETAQQTNVDVVETMAGYEIWAGGSDGMVRMWENPSLKEGRIEADTCFEAHDGSVTSTIVHPCGSILATCAAQ
ncbi:WD40 repeat-like protein, partial [Saccharata proteae CBS 121410]